MCESSSVFFLTSGECNMLPEIMANGHLFVAAAISSMAVVMGMML